MFSFLRSGRCLYELGCESGFYLAGMNGQGHKTSAPAIFNPRIYNYGSALEGNTNRQGLSTCSISSSA